MEVSGKGTMDVGNIAASMYAMRVEEDTRAGLGELYSGADAQRLYFKGAHDVMVCLQEWMRAGVPPARLAEFLDELYEQTEVVAVA